MNSFTLHSCFVGVMNKLRWTLFTVSFLFWARGLLGLCPLIPHCVIYIFTVMHKRCSGLCLTWTRSWVYTFCRGNSCASSKSHCKSWQVGGIQPPWFPLVLFYLGNCWNFYFYLKFLLWLPFGVYVAQINKVIFYAIKQAVKDMKNLKNLHL